VVGKHPVELEKYLEKKNSLFLKKICISTLILFNTYIAAFMFTVTKYYSSYVAVPFLRKITKI
jgi:hypothetical protein